MDGAIAKGYFCHVGARLRGLQGRIFGTPKIVSSAPMLDARKPTLSDTTVCALVTQSMLEKTPTDGLTDKLAQNERRWHDSVSFSLERIGDA